MKTNNRLLSVLQGIEYILSIAAITTVLYIVITQIEDDYDDDDYRDYYW